MDALHVHCVCTCLFPSIYFIFIFYRNNLDDIIYDDIVDNINDNSFNIDDNVIIQLNLTLTLT